MRITQRCYTICFYFIFCILFLYSCKTFDTKNSYKIVNASTGLIIRETPSLEGEKIGLIPYGSKILILKISDNKDTVLDFIDKIIPRPIESNWYYINYNGTKGWVFGGFAVTQADFEKKIKLENLCKFIDNPFMYNFKRFGNVQENLFASFGKPNNIVQKKIPNKHQENEFDTDFTFEYGNLEFKIHSTYFNKQILELIIIKKERSDLKYNINIGIKSNEIENIFGKGKVLKNNKLLFTCEGIEPGYIYTEQVNNKINKLIISTPSD